MRAPEENSIEMVELTKYLLAIQHTIAASAAASLIIKDGQIVYEWYNGRHNHQVHSRAVDAQSQFNVASIRKTYLGLVVSLAVYEGKIGSIDDLISDYDSTIDKELLGNTTIRNVLTHTHGLRGSERIFQPGTDWEYNNTGVQILTKIIHNVYERPFTQIIDELVFRPYGFMESGWRIQQADNLIWLDDSYDHKDGTESNLFVSAQDLATWGLLHLHQGCLHGQQTIPREVYEQSASIISPPIQASSPRNGYYWFVQDIPRQRSEIGEDLPKGTFQSLGITGCVCLIIPEINAVAVRMYNQTTPNPPEYNYLQDIKHFGNLVYKSLL